MMKKIEQKEMSGLRDCIRQIVKNDGYLGFFKGLQSLIYRDTLSYGFYFVCFEYLRRKSIYDYGIDNEIFRDLVCGGLAGKFFI